MSPTSANRGASTPRMGAERMSTIAYRADAASDRARTRSTSSRSTRRPGRWAGARAGGVGGGLRWGFGCVHGTTVTASATLDFMNRDFMGALRERVLVFDGAMGTHAADRRAVAGRLPGPRGLQRDPVRDPARRGRGASTRPTSRPAPTRSRPTRSAASPIVLAEYGIADQVARDQPAGRPARPGGGRRLPRRDRPRWVVPGRSGPGPSCRRSATSTYDVLARRYADQACGLLDGRRRRSC